MAIQPIDGLEVLSSLHLPGMAPELKRTLVYLAQGTPRKEIARREGVSVHTVRAWVGQATAEIQSRLQEKHPNAGELRGAWVFANLGCCLREESRSSS